MADALTPAEEKAIQAAQAELDRLRAWKTRKPKPLERRGGTPQSLSFVKAMFHKEYAQPARQLGPLSDAWQAVVPEPMRSQARLVGLRGGTLQVNVPSSAVRWQLMRLVQRGLPKQLAEASGGKPVRRIVVQVVAE